jgi:F-type H+-transporting ATPase subunit delta
MPKTDIKHGGPAAQYARAVLDLANQAGVAQAIGQELDDIKAVIQANPSFHDFLRDPAISPDERRTVLDRTFAQSVSTLVMNTLRVMNLKGRLGLLPTVADHYRQLLDEQLGNINVELTVPQVLDEPMLAQVRQKVSQALRKNATVTQVVDESILGGMVLKIDDRVIDGSAKAQLQALRHQLMAAAPK